MVCWQPDLRWRQDGAAGVKHFGRMLLAGSTKRRFFWGLLVVGMVTVQALAADDELPKRAPGDALDFEPALMLNDRAGETTAEAASPSTPEADAERLHGEVNRARTSAVRAERLYKSGVLAKVDAEKRVLKVVQLTSDLEEARRRVATRELEAQRKAFAGGQLSADDLRKAEAALATATANAATATAAWQQAQLDSAILDLKRKRQLLAAGIGSKAMVRRAEEKLAALQLGAVAR